jgi:hypothetical protein
VSSERNQAGVMGGVTAAASAAGMWRHQQACFAGDMPILSEHGSLRADAVRVDDRLWSQSEFDPAGELALQVVEEVFVRLASILHVDVQGRIIRTTAEHPFYVVGSGWIAAGALQIGDLLQTDDKRLLPVEGVADSGRFETVYNFRVAEFHTYFVGCAEWGFTVWAHNEYGRQLEGASRQGTLMQRAWEYRQSIGRATGNAGHYKFNVAVVRYQTATGQVRTRAFRSGTQLPDGSWTYSGGSRNHSEQRMIRWLERNGFTANDVLSVYSERSPCGGCSPALRDFGISRNNVYYAVPYGASSAQLRDAYGNFR